MITPETLLETLPKFKPKLIAELAKLDITKAIDLLYYFPTRYEDYSNLMQIKDILPGELVSIKGTIKNIRAQHALFGRVGRTEATLTDETGKIKVTWFHMPYLAETFAVGDELFLSGKAAEYKGTLQLQNPIYEKIKISADTGSSGPGMYETVHTARIIPIYKLTAQLPLRTLRTAIFSVLAAADNLPETLPDEIAQTRTLLPLNEAIRNLHFPKDFEILERARERLAFEEIFTVQLAVQKHKTELAKERALKIPFSQHLIKEFTSKLDFQLTPDQKKAMWEILQDLEKPQPMNRLLEGDVGSGKTLVALGTALEVIQNSFQAVLLAPTEILAQQHYKNALKYFEEYPRSSLILLTGNSALLNGRKIPKQQILDEIAHGGPQFIISTHAILQKGVSFKELAYVIIDEQHRFGVQQRAALVNIKNAGGKSIHEKNSRSGIIPHLLSMTATPIPRSLKLALFGDLDVSQIRHKPQGRKTIVTKLVKSAERTEAYKFIKKQLDAGRQAFVVTPLIEESDTLGVRAANAEHKTLQELFSGYTVGLLHGRMKSKEKDEIMAEFLKGTVDILVTTSVIEVGVDVPNASVMAIEGSERFGLAQLHQLRGRVGRAGHQSYCLLFSESLNPAALSRLQEFSKIHDGFELAELDLETRGFGNLYGIQQSGYMKFKFFSFRDHRELLKNAQSWAKTILADDPALKKHQRFKKLTDDYIVHLE